MALGFPYSIDLQRRTATQEGDELLHGMIEQVLFTSPGERLNRPTFGCGLRQLVFAPASDEMLTTVQVLVHGALQQWLGELIHVDSVDVSPRDSMLVVSVAYSVLQSGDRKVASFSEKLP